MAIVRTRTLGLFVLAALALVETLAIALLDARAQARSDLEGNFAANALKFTERGRQIVVRAQPAPCCRALRAARARRCRP